ncbi:MAG: TadE/TadG family type IV pilus assembly protein [Sulfuricella sp.]|nr:TadE/TadG family type IV pilus assembly protein [Sulfuricella sp.]
MRSTRKQIGAAVVEFALVLLPLTLIVFGITEFGRAMYQYNTLVKATRDAARFLSTQAAGTGYGRATCLTVAGSQTCSASDPPLAPGLTASMVAICDATTAPSENCPLAYNGVSTGSGAVNLVTVSINGFQFTSLVSFVVPSVTFGPISTTMRQIL